MNGDITVFTKWCNGEPTFLLYNDVGKVKETKNFKDVKSKYLKRMKPEMEENNEDTSQC